MYFVFVQLQEKFMNIVHGVYGMEAYDTLFMNDTKENVNNIMGCIFFQKFEYEKMKTYLEQKTSNLDKCRMKIVKIYGQWWYKEMS